MKKTTVSRIGKRSNAAGKMKTTMNSGQRSQDASPAPVACAKNQSNTTAAGNGAGRNSNPNPLNSNMKKLTFQSLSTAALSFAARGWRVFPLRPNSKRPAIKGWLDKATTNPDQIRGWWDECQLYNIGVLCGSKSGISVLDIDGWRGKRSLARLEAKLGALPETQFQRTPGKGKHLIFRSGSQSLLSRIGIDDGIDYLADGWHFVAAPSCHPNGGTYEFFGNDQELAELPEAWKKWIAEQVPRIDRNSAYRYGHAYDRVHETEMASDDWHELVDGWKALAEGWRDFAVRSSQQ